MDLLEEENIDFDLDVRSSRRKIYEAQVGVAIISTILFDRMHLGLDSLFYFGPEIPDHPVDARFMGSYARYSYGDMDELEGKLDRLLDGLPLKPSLYALGRT